MVGNTLARARSLVHRFLGREGVELTELLRKDLRRLTKRIEQLEESQRNATELARRADRTSVQV